MTEICEHQRLKRSCQECDLEDEIRDLKILLSRAWDAIQEAGYEDFDFDLRDQIEEVLR